MKRTMAVGVMVLAFGCGKKTESGASAGSGGSGEAKETADKGELPASVMAWVPKGATEAWQGAWTSRMTLEMGGTHSMAGDPAAIEVKGDKATVFDGKADHALDFAITSPCSARFTQALDKGGKSFHDKQFVLKDGKLLIGESAAGYRKGKTAVVCTVGASGGVYVVPETGDCEAWEVHFDKWESKKDTCAWSQEGGKEVLKLGTGDWATKVTSDGDLLMSDQFIEESKLSDKVADMATAKSAIAAKVKADDPGEQAKAAGGKVGDTSTIVSLGATYAADKSLKGKPLEITALYLNSNSSTFTSGGTTQHNYAAVLVDSRDAMKFTLDCTTKEEVKGFKQYDKVVAKGTIGESFGRPSLEDCTITKAP